MNSLNTPVGDLDVTLQVLNAQRPSRKRLPVEHEVDEHFRLRTRQYNRRIRPQTRRCVHNSNTLDVKRVLDLQERQLRPKLRTRRPEVT